MHWVSGAAEHSTKAQDRGSPFGHDVCALPVEFSFPGLGLAREDLHVRDKMLQYEAGHLSVWENKLLLSREALKTKSV